MNPLPLSIVLIALNEERDLPGCLESIRGLAQEMILVDSGSTDATRDIARRFGVKVFDRTWDGFAAQKQYALEQATQPWVLNLDADERVTPELAGEIQTLLRGSPEADGYRIPFHHYFLGDRLRFGGLRGETHVRLFKRESARYGGQVVHEGIEIAGTVGRLKFPIDHYSYRSMEDYFTKFNFYTSLIARQKFNKGVRFHWWHHARLPYEFFVRYVLKLGFLDGGKGLTYAALSAYYVWTKFLKLRDLEETS